MRSKLILSVLVAVLLAVGGVSLASAAGSDEGGRDAKVITVTSRAAQEADLDLGATGLSVGDRFTFSDDLLKDGRTVGTDGGECVIVRIEPEGATEQTAESVTAQCVVTLSLEHGQITVQGLVTFTNAPATEPFRVAITGGTGDFRTAHGEVEVTEVSPNEDRLTIRLVL